MEALQPAAAESLSARSSPGSHLLRREARALLALGAPLIAAQLAQISMNFVDTVMAGNLSPQDLAAVAMGGSLWMPLFVFGMGVLMSISPTVANSFGAGERIRIGRHVRQGLWLSLAVAAVSFVVIRQAAPILLQRMEIPPEIIPTSIGYLRAVSWGVPASCALIVLRSFSEAVSMTRPMTFISLIGLVAHIAGNYIFMYGHLGMPRLGAVGCGVATAMVMWIMLACLVAWILWQPYYRPFGVFAHFEWPRPADIAALVRLGTPIGVSLFMEGSLFAVVSLVLGRHFGAEVVAGHQIALNVASVTFMVPLGIAIAITVRVGQAKGAGDLRGARRAGFVGGAMALAFMSLAALTLATVPELIAAIYTNDREVRSIAVSLLTMAALFQIFDGLQVAGAGALRGLKDTAVPMGITCVSYWVVGFTVGYTLGIVQGRGAQAMWLGLTLGLVVAAVLLNTRFYLLMRRMIRAKDELQFTRDAGSS